MKKIGALLAFISVTSFHTWSQEMHDTFNTVEVTAHQNIKKTFTDLSSVKVFSIKDNLQATLQNLDEFLTQNSSIFIKKMGVNSLSTLSLRGASSAQSLVLWEGIPIQNSMNGATDISLFNAGLFEQLSIDYDGNSSLYGTGNVGGALHLNSQIRSTSLPEIYAGLHAGSFNNFSAYTKTFFSQGQHNFYAKAIVHSGKNNFPYTYQGKEKTLEHAHQRHVSGLFGWENNKILKSLSPISTALSYHLWLQNNDREMPPAYFENMSTKVQNEGSIRQTAKLSATIHPHAMTYVQAAWIYDEHQFRDSLAFMQQDLTSHQLYAEWGLKSAQPIPLRNWNLDYLLFMPISYQDLNNTLTHNSYNRRFTAVAGILQLNYKKQLYFQFNTRAENNVDFDVPLLNGAKISYAPSSFSLAKMYHHVQGFISYQTSFRAPLLHEIHQFPGGNKSLQPEYGYNIEVGIKSHQSTMNSKYQLQTQLVYFNRTINDWIYWLGATIWTPYNIAEVQTHGWDIQLKNTYQMTESSHLTLNADHSYTIATTSISKLPNNETVGKQIPYTPRYNTRINLGYNSTKISAFLGMGYTGYVFTSLDESQYLLPYFLINSQVSYTFIQNKKYKLSTSLSINNALDHNYHTIQNRPMPGRNFQLSMHLSPR